MLNKLSTCLLALGLLLGASGKTHALTEAEVNNATTPCLSYLTLADSPHIPTSGCYTSFKALADQANQESLTNPSPTVLLGITQAIYKVAYAHRFSADAMDSLALKANGYNGTPPFTTWHVAAACIRTGVLVDLCRPILPGAPSTFP